MLKMYQIVKHIVIHNLFKTMNRYFVAVLKRGVEDECDWLRLNLFIVLYVLRKANGAIHISCTMIAGLQYCKIMLAGIFFT